MEQFQLIEGRELCVGDYFIDAEKPPIIKGLRKSSHFTEDRIKAILREGIQCKKDVMHILAWKMGKFRHYECTEDYVYAEDWKDAEKYEVKIGNRNENLEGFCKSVLECANSYKGIKWTDEAAQEVMNKLKKVRCQRIGSVYIITLLYFISNGKYPIYDQFAMKGLLAIEQKAKPDREGQGRVDWPANLRIPEVNSKAYDRIISSECYYEYRKLLKKYFGEEAFSSCRKIDQMLWMYGHAFKCGMKGTCR